MATVAEVLARALARHGIDTVFGQSIPSLLFLATPKVGVRQVTYRTENAGAVMADGYARVSGRIGAVAAQNGPAATLLVPGLAEALKASVPLLAIVQDVALANLDRNAFQELDHFELFRGVAKWVRRLHTAERIDDYVDMAVTAATSGRPGPAVLLVPYDLLDKPCPLPDQRAAHSGAFPLDRVVADPQRIAQAARLIAEAEHPLVIAGGGVHLSAAADHLAQLQEAFSLPVATTTMGKGAVDERHPLSLGVVGYFMGPGGVARHQRRLIDQADAILLIGSRTNQNGTDSWSLLPRTAKLIHLDLDGGEVGRNYESVRLVGDASLTLAALTAALEGGDVSKRHAGRARLEKQIAEGRERYRRELAKLLSSKARMLRPEQMMHDVDQLLLEDDIVVADASYASIWVANSLTARRPGQRFITPRGIAGLGWGLPLAIGAKLAQPRSRVFCFAGDGGFSHVWSELETLRRTGIDVILTVLNNGILGYQKHAEEVLFGAHTDAITIESVDHAAIARACGIHGVRAESAEAYRRALAIAVDASGSTLIEAIIDPDAYPPINTFEGKRQQT